VDSLVDKIKSGYLWDFPGGVFPPERKSLSNSQSIKQLELANEYIVPVKQHIGHAANVIVELGQLVKKGQPLTELQGPMELPVHAPTSGEVIAIEPRMAAHPSGLSELAVVIKPDGEDTWYEKKPTPNYLALSKVELLDKLKQAGISGLGGASFPTYVKQSNSQPIELLIINGVECEPYITADDMLMREYATEIVSGIEIFTHLLQPKLVVIAIENNKPEAIAAIEQACQGKSQFVVRAIPTKYPAGGEKQLIQVITGQEVPSHGITADIGIITQNVGTAFAAYKAIVQGEPLIERVVTVTGEQIKSPANVWARIGTPVSHLLAAQEYQALKRPRIIMGGPMMGFTLHGSQVPVSKITNCVLAPSEKALPRAENEQACIRCGYCADACPASLLPQQLYWHSKAKEYEKAQDYKLFDCIECGACAYVCPSEIPLVQYYRIAKADIKAEQVEQEKAEKAKERFNARNERLEREKQERLEKHKKAAESRKQSMAKDPSAQDKVAAALARVQAKKKSSPETDQTDKTQTTEPANAAKAKAAAAIARAKAKRAAAAQEATAVETAEKQANNQESADQQTQTDSLTPAQIRAKAIAAKAKAKQAAKESMTESEQAPKNANSEKSTEAQADEPSADEQLTPAQIRAKAIAAKVKAKQQAKTQNSESADSPDNAEAKTNTEFQEDKVPTDEKLTPAQAKAKAIAAKIKAKQQAQSVETKSPEVENEPNTEKNMKDHQTPDAELTEAELRQQRVKAAIAKAKAKKESLGDK